MRQGTNQLRHNVVLSLRDGLNKDRRVALRQRDSINFRINNLHGGRLRTEIDRGTGVDLDIKLTFTR